MDFWGALGVFLGALGARRASWSILGGSLGTPRELLEGSWGLMGRSWDILVAPGGLLGKFLGGPWGLLAAPWGLFWGLAQGLDQKTKSAKTN